MLLFKKILDFQKVESVLAKDKRGAQRYPVGAKYPLKAKITLVARDGEGNPLPPTRTAPMDWGGQLSNLSTEGANIRLHPAAVAGRNDPCTLKLELDNVLFEVDGTVANFRTTAQFVSVGVVLRFPDDHTRRAFKQLMEPVVVGSSLAPASGRVKQDLPGLVKESYKGESESELHVWRDATGRAPRLFELLLHDYFVRGNSEMPGLKLGYRDGAKVGAKVSRPSFPIAMAPGHQAEVTQLFRFVVQNFTKSVPSDVRKFLELFVS